MVKIARRWNEERRESGEDKREFEELLKAGLARVRPAEKTMSATFIN
jgi:hypothetical protein